MSPWTDRARRALVAQRRAGAGWGYRAGTETAAEPTALAALALAADPGSSEAASASRESAAWLAGLQDADGAVGVSAAVRRPRWPTAPALLLWSVAAGFDEPRRRARAWLLSRRGDTWAPQPDSPYGHDTRLDGWPWVEGTHPWLEPTAWAMLALARDGDPASGPRIGEGVRLILDRAVPSGGWNYGNRSVFGTDLRARPAPTGLALVALAAAEPGGPQGARRPHAVAPAAGDPVAAALGDLEAVLPETRAGQSLGWGLLGLAAWDRRPRGAGAWLDEALERAVERGAVLDLAALLLAASPGAPALLGLGTPAGEGR